MTLNWEVMVIEMSCKFGFVSANVGMAVKTGFQHHQKQEQSPTNNVRTFVECNLSFRNGVTVVSVGEEEYLSVFGVFDWVLSIVTPPPNSTEMCSDNSIQTSNHIHLRCTHQSWHFLVWKSFELFWIAKTWISVLGIIFNDWEHQQFTQAILTRKSSRHICQKSGSCDPTCFNVIGLGDSGETVRLGNRVMRGQPLPLQFSHGMTLELVFHSLHCFVIHNQQSVICKSICGMRIHNFGSPINPQCHVKPALAHLKTAF